jgi:hypothetical protein
MISKPSAVLAKFVDMNSAWIVVAQYGYRLAKEKV